jgi:hypothetical protein
MKLWVKLLGLTLGIVTITGVAATIRKVKNDEKARLPLPRIRLTKISQPPTCYVW